MMQLSCVTSAHIEVELIAVSIERIIVSRSVKSSSMLEKVIRAGTYVCMYTHVYDVWLYWSFVVSFEICSYTA